MKNESKSFKEEFTAQKPITVSVENLPNTPHTKKLIQSMLNCKYPGQIKLISFENESHEYLSVYILCSSSIACLNIRQLFEQLDELEFFPNRIIIGTKSGQEKVNNTSLDTVRNSTVKRNTQLRADLKYGNDEIRLRRLQFYNQKKPSDSIDCFFCHKWVHKEGLENHFKLFHPLMAVLGKAKCPVCERKMADSGKGEFELLPCGHYLCSSCVVLSRQERIKEAPFHVKPLEFFDKCPTCRAPNQGYGVPMLAYE